MAEFRNPIPTQSGGSVPIGSFKKADFSGVLSQALDLGEEQVIRANRRELSEQVSEEAEGFIEQPERISDLQRMAQELEQERGQPRQQQNTAIVRRIKGDMQKLKRAVDQGAMSSTEVRMRADQLTREAIAENPSLSNELIEERNQTLGLFGGEIQATDEMLQPPEEDEQTQELLQRQKKTLVDLINNNGGVVTDFSLPNLVEQAKPYMEMEARANVLSLQSEVSENRQTLRENQAVEAGQAWTQQKFMQMRGRLEQVFNSEEMGQEEKIQAVNDMVAQLRTDARSHDVLGNLTPDRLDSLIGPAVDRLEDAKSFINGEIERTQLRNRWDSMVYQNVIRASAENPGILSTATASKFGGEIVGELVSQQVPGGISGQTDSFVQGAIEVISADKKVSSDQIDAYRQQNVFDNYFENISNFENLGVPREEAQTAARTLIKNLMPDDMVDLNEVELERFHKALPILSRTNVADMAQRTGMSEQTLERLNNRIQQYMDTHLVPNLTSRLTEPMARFTQRAETPEGQGPAFTRRQPTATSVINFVNPVWSGGNLRLELDRSKIPEEVRNDPQAMQDVENKVRKIQETYVPKWNSAMKASANFTFGSLEREPSDSDVRGISQQMWESNFGELATNDEEGENNQRSNGGNE